MPLSGYLLQFGVPFTVRVRVCAPLRCQLLGESPLQTHLRGYTFHGIRARQDSNEAPSQPHSLVERWHSLREVAKSDLWWLEG